MAWTYDCDYELQSYRLTPIKRRTEVRLAFQNCIDGQIQWNHDKFFDTYINGSSYAFYSNVTAYVDGDRVNYQNRVYECILASTGNLPTDTTYWVLVANDFRGVVERIKYNCQRLMMEWLLNKWFGSTFNQPGSGTSDIYITDNDRESSTFTVFQNDLTNGVALSSAVFESANFVNDFVMATPSYAFVANFDVNYPVALIPTITDEKYYQLVNLVEKYKTFGTTVNYISY